MGTPPESGSTLRLVWSSGNQLLVCYSLSFGSCSNPVSPSHKTLLHSLKSTTMQSHNCPFSPEHSKLLARAVRQCLLVIIQHHHNYLHSCECTHAWLTSRPLRISSHLALVGLSVWAFRAWNAGKTEIMRSYKWWNLSYLAGKWDVIFPILSKLN